MKPLTKYKHALSITSQVYFCSIPLRLDSYNYCSHSCGYCFSMTRQGYGRRQKLKFADSVSLDKRLLRVSDGVKKSAVDDFLGHRIPVQLGGMSDPFSDIENTHKNTLLLMNVLQKYNYPYVISTKGVSLAEPIYLDVLENSNAYVRFSVTVLPDSVRDGVDKDCPSSESLYNAVEKISRAGVPVNFRLQPVFPGSEEAAFEIVKSAHSLGVKHISAEYLKVPIDANLKFSDAVKNLLGGEPIKRYMDLGARRIGREYVLPVSYRSKYLIKLREAVNGLGMTFGYADNDLLLYGDGMSCCSAAELYLYEANTFDANFVGVAKAKKVGELISFSDFDNKWFPKHNISPYLNSKSRVSGNGGTGSDWHDYIRMIWEGAHGVYCPTFFVGVEKINEKDANGNTQYVRVASDFD